jgi:hypothetical protein
MGQQAGARRGDADGTDCLGSTVEDRRRDTCLTDHRLFALDGVPALTDCRELTLERRARIERVSPQLPQLVRWSSSGPSWYLSLSACCSTSPCA